MAPLKAMVVDEDRELQDVLTMFLRDEGFRITELQPGVSVLEAVRGNNIDICLLGGHVGDSDAVDIARSLRRDAACGIIILGAGQDEVDAVVALEMGADDYIPKPPRLRELGARVRSVLRRTVVTPANETGERPLPSHYLRQLDDMKICAVLRSVEVAGEEIALTQLEFDVLMVFVNRVNTVVSREDVISHVRGSQWSISRRVVDNVVSALRRKLFRDGSGGQRLQTVYGRGYKLVHMADAAEG